MRTPLSLPALGLIFAASLITMDCDAGQFKRITIDGSFADWAGVEPTVVDPEDATGSFDFKEIYVANDDQYLYLRFRLYTAANYDSFNHRLLIDADANPATGGARLGVGAELMIENGSGYQQKNGGWNEGAVSNLGWASAPGGLVTEFEARISRNVLDAEGLPVFSAPSILLAAESVDRNWNTVDAGPDTGGLAYDFAATPAKATGSTTLASLTATPWRYNDSGTDLLTDWLAAGYDDTQAGWKSGSGLFGFGTPAGTYPAAIASAMTAGNTTYYLRVPFTWDKDSQGIALAVDCYLSDGVVFYLNGTEVKRLRIPDGAVAYTTQATGGPTAPGNAEVFTLPAAALMVGTNVLEVELHQSAATPADLAFGLKLVATDSLPPSIDDATQPADRAVVEGDSTSFSVGNVLGTVPLAYKWFKDGVAIESGTNATLTIPVVLVTDAGGYKVEISNATGVKATSRTAQLTTTAVSVSITNNAEPADRAITEGESTTFTVQIAGSPELFYQWFKNDAPIGGANAADYTITNAALSDAGAYSVIVTNRVNGVTSREAQLTVGRDVVAPTIVQVSGSAAKVIVRFSEPVEEASAKAASNYRLTGGGIVQSAAFDLADPQTVTLTTAPLTFGSVYTLTATGVKDLFGNASSASAQFRSTIIIDGNFEDWAGMTPVTTETQDTPEGLEFKEIYAANDDDFIYLRFNFYADVGQLTADTFLHIFSDTDSDVATGSPNAGVGSEMMIENSGGYQQKNGGFNEGGVRDMDFALSPEAKSSEYECRISRHTVYDGDGLPVYNNDKVTLVLQLISGTWANLDIAPVGGFVYTFVQYPPLNPSPLKISVSAGKVEIRWTGAGMLEARDSVSGGSWTTVTGATSPYQVTPSGTQSYYRLRL